MQTKLQIDFEVGACLIGPDLKPSGGITMIVAENEIEALLKQLWTIDEADASPVVVSAARYAADALCIYVDTAAAEVEDVK